MTSGPLIYQYLHRKAATRYPYEAYEYPVYTDARILGSLPNLGGIEFLNTVRQVQRTEIPALALRIESRRSGIGVGIDFSKTDMERWHGGTLPDEICALLSLALRARFQAGRHNRIFSQADPQGHPYAFDRPLPKVPTISDFRQLVVPVLAREKHLGDAQEFFRKLPELHGEDCTVLVKAARLYQHAAWLSESEAHLSWLLLVSAVETIADHVWKGEETDPLEDIRILSPSLAVLIERVGDEALRREFIAELGRRAAATRKFLTCLRRFDPGPPADRPSGIAQVDWSEASLQKSLARIYQHRSRALHAGVAFPMPMCDDPAPDPFSRKPVEKPISPVIATDTAVWTEEDLPMLLWVFEHLVAGAIQGWWKSLA